MDVIEQARNTIERAKRMQTQLVSAANVAAKNVEHDLVEGLKKLTSQRNALNEAALVSVRAHAQQ